jgi:hypothetical protein|tara:strand:+ start:197 stop:601 length:405 start_codon:yes stop_codon:yes gene_type:complete
MNYQVIKLSNGEDIICNVEELESGKFKITSPLKMCTQSKITERGVIESLGLSRWVQVYSDQPYYNIEKNSVVIMTPASEGLGRYYEHVLKSMEQAEVNGPTDEELNSIEEEEYLDEMDDVEFLAQWEVKNKVYH